MDIMYATGWTISDNIFIGIQGRTREARGAIFLWHDSRDCVIERNIIIDCDSGICLGNSSKRDDTETHCRRCIVRNNFLTRTPENGILADYTTDCAILHNTIHDPASRQKRLIRLVHDNDGLLVANNLISGPPLMNRSTGTVRIQGNITRVLTDRFLSARNGNLRLTEAVSDVTDAAKRLPSVIHDIDGVPRDKQTDIGADEFRAGQLE